MNESLAFDPNDVCSQLDQRHRDVMLDLILTWGSLDGALGMLLSCVKGLPFDQGAELISKRPNAAKLSEICKTLRGAPGGEDAARIMEKHKKNYEHYSQPRNRIAHSRCIGIWTEDTEILVFATFQKVSENELVVDLVPIQEMQRATRWGQAMTDMALKLVDTLSPDTC